MCPVTALNQGAKVAPAPQAGRQAVPSLDDLHLPQVPDPAHPTASPTTAASQSAAPLSVEELRAFRQNVATYVDGRMAKNGLRGQGFDADIDTLISMSKMSDTQLMEQLAKQHRGQADADRLNRGNFERWTGKAEQLAQLASAREQGQAQQAVAPRTAQPTTVPIPMSEAKVDELANLLRTSVVKSITGEKADSQTLQTFAGNLNQYIASLKAHVRERGETIDAAQLDASITDIAGIMNQAGLTLNAKGRIDFRQYVSSLKPA